MAIRVKITFIFELQKYFGPDEGVFHRDPKRGKAIPEYIRTSGRKATPEKIIVREEREIIPGGIIITGFLIVRSFGSLYGNLLRYMEKFHIGERQNLKGTGEPVPLRFLVELLSGPGPKNIYC
ncbi:MAG: hypothetical protein P4L51_18895 [Puia sp.]|nr:hypothetical protein [Puia sp.]